MGEGWGSRNLQVARICSGAIYRTSVAAGFSLRSIEGLNKGSRNLQVAKFKYEKIIEKKHRLSSGHYRGSIRVTFTFCIEGNNPLFSDNSVVDIFLKALKEAESKFDCKNWIYVFMPDHLHIIMEGNSEKSDLWKMDKLFKQKTGYWLAQNKSGIEWQKDFYDHIHRKDEDLKKHIRYILDNPIRKRLISDWQEYPYKGSLDYSLEEIT
jgi:putative transposase